MLSLRTLWRLLAFASAAALLTLHTFGQGVSISEIMYHPASTNVLDAWLEVENSSSTTMSLAGWRLTRGVAFTFPAGASIQPAVTSSSPPMPPASTPGIRRSRMWSPAGPEP